MPDKVLPLNCQVDSQITHVTPGLGYRDKNKVVLKITSTEEVKLEGRGASGNLSITVSLGTDQTDLIAKSEENLGDKVSADKWKNKNYKSAEVRDKLSATWTWSFDQGTVFKAGEEVVITIADFESRTDPGDATIEIFATMRGYSDYKKEVKVQKQTKPGELNLLYFTADPPYIITDDDRANFKLEWNAIEAGKAVLYGNNAQLEQFEEGKGKFESGQKFTFTGEKPSFTTIYKLVATDKKNETNRKEQQVTVQVLAPNWYSIKFPNYGYPAVLCSADEIKLYGIFIKQGKAGLYSSEYPYAAWTLVSSYVPDGMETSPAVYFGNKLWLVGGSTANPNIRNNAIWSYDPGTSEWKKQEQESVPWTARMGQACVVFNNKLWVLGGFDETGTSLNDVWAAELNREQLQLQWTKNPYIPIPPPGVDGWTPRCMFAATVVNKSSFKITDPSLKSLRSEKVPEDVLTKLNKIKSKEVEREMFLDLLKDTIGEQQLDRYRSSILKYAVNQVLWIYGGVKAPFSDPLDDMWYSENGENWTPYTALPMDNKKRPIGKPIGSTLQVIKDHLHLIGSFRSGTTVTPRKCMLSEGQELWETTVVERPWYGQESNTFSLLSVQHKGLIFLRSLDYRTRDNPTELYMYVP